MLLTKRSEGWHAEDSLVLKNSDRGNGWVISYRFVQRHSGKKMGKCRQKEKTAKT